MKSKFSKIAKVRKQKRDAIERELIKSQNKEKLLQHKIASLYEEIVAMQTPQNGTISLLSLLNEQKRILNRDKKEHERALHVAQDNSQKLQAEYHKAHIEFEKINYLEEQDIKAFMYKIKMQEQLELDEISTMLFANGKSKKGE
ncbi:MAG: flagellar export protein FliJ [Sulfurospirillaceae bacterium]|nr:flagellar export protein FliJ [Sulfurospirillaceae bacterium]MDD2827070.1 flagellar export protein FliJ [Sulfurospirillaceae bacterium]